MEYPQAEQVKIRAAIHLSFEVLQAIDLPFQLTIAPRQGESGVDGLVILLEIGGKVAHHRDTRDQRVSKPLVQLIYLPLDDHLNKSLG